MSDYQLLICPVCLSQVEDHSEEGAWCYHNGYGHVEPMEVPVSVPAKDLSEAQNAAQPALEDSWEREAKRRKEREEWEALPSKEKERFKAERWAKLTPIEKAMDEAVWGVLEDLRKPSFLEQISAKRA